jgi:hypothetical protein
MMDRFPLGLLALAALVVGGSVAAQEIALPFASGKITVAAGWTVLGAKELAEEARDSDPVAGTAKVQLLGLVADLRAKNRTDQHLILHRSGLNPEQLQMINCYSTDEVPSSEELVAEEAASKMSQVLATEIGGQDLAITCTGHEVSEMFAIKSLLMHFAMAEPASAWRMDVLVVPSGDRLQYFESQYLADDAQAIANIDAVLRTYDGAKEPDTRVSNLLIGGLAGAVAGILTALFRRRRHMRIQGHLTQTGSEAAPS